MQIFNPSQDKEKVLKHKSKRRNYTEKGDLPTSKQKNFSVLKAYVLEDTYATNMTEKD